MLDEADMKTEMDREAMERAVTSFLIAAGLDPSAPELRDTPRKVTEAWAEELLAGYAESPKAILGETCATTRTDPVVVSGISFVGVCPHHLLPYRGVAKVGYLPSERVAGFGSLVRLVLSLGARLVLQEDLTHDIASALTEHLGARGAACIVEARHGCVGLRGVRQPEVRTMTEAWTGVLAKRGTDERRSIERLLAETTPPRAGDAGL